MSEPENRDSGSQNWFSISRSLNLYHLVDLIGPKSKPPLLSMAIDTSDPPPIVDQPHEVYGVSVASADVTGDGTPDYVVFNAGVQQILILALQKEQSCLTVQPK